MRTGTPPSARQRRSTSPSGGRRRWRSSPAAKPLRRRHAQPVGAPLDASRRACASSVAIAAMRSVSLTRQLPMLRSVVGAVGEQRDDRRASSPRRGWRTQSIVAPLRAQRPPAPRSSPSPQRMSAPMRASASAKRDVALDRLAADASTRTGPPPIAPAARKYERRRGVALDAERAGARVAGAGRHREASPAPRADVDAEAAHEVDRDLDVRPRDQLALDLDRASCRSARCSGSASSSAVRNWLDTSPRIAHSSHRPRRRRPGRSRAADSPSRRVADVGAERRSASTRSPIGRSCMRGTPRSS